MAVAGAVVAISSFFVIVGLPYSYASVTEQCSAGNQCVQVTRLGSSFAPTQVAAIPLVLGVLVFLGVFKQRGVISWGGMIGLLVFSLVSLFSIGLLYLPFAMTLLGLLAAVWGRSASEQKLPQGPTADSS